MHHGPGAGNKDKKTSPYDIKGASLAGLVHPAIFDGCCGVGVGDLHDKSARLPIEFCFHTALLKIPGVHDQKMVAAEFPESLTDQPIEVQLTVSTSIHPWK